MLQSKKNLWPYIGLYVVIYTTLVTPFLLIALICVILSTSFFFPTAILSGIAAYIVQWRYYKKHQKVFTKTDNKKLILRCAVMMSFLQSLIFFVLGCVLYKPLYKESYDDLISFSLTIFTFTTLLYYFTNYCGFNWSRKKFMKKQLKDKKRKEQLLKKSSVISEKRNIKKNASSSPFIT